MLYESISIHSRITEGLKIITVFLYKYASIKDVLSLCWDMPSMGSQTLMHKALLMAVIHV